MSNSLTGMKSGKPLDRCRMCQAPLDASDYLYSAFWKDITVRHFRCHDCGFIWANPPLSDDSLLKIYQSPVYWGSASDDTYLYTDYEKDFFAYYRDGQKRFKKIVQLVPDIKSLKMLEIGCGAGFTLKAFTDNGVDALGIDPSSEMIDFAVNKLNLNCECCTLEQFQGRAGIFDLITMWGTFMCLSQPDEALRKAYELLKPGGVFVMDLFDMNSPFSFLTARKRRKGVHIISSPTKKGLEVFSEKMKFEHYGFIKYSPFYSLGFIATQIDVDVIKKTVAKYLNSIGLPAIVPGFYLFWARK